MSEAPPPYPSDLNAPRPRYSDINQLTSASESRQTGVRRRLLPSPLPAVQAGGYTSNNGNADAPPGTLSSPLLTAPTSLGPHSSAEKNTSGGVGASDVANGATMMSSAVQRGIPDSPSPLPQPKQSESQNPIGAGMESSLRSRTLLTSGAGHTSSDALKNKTADDSVEQLCPLPASARPVERFFVEYQPIAAGREVRSHGYVDEDEALFSQLAEFTNDDSFFSSGTSVLEEDARRMQHDPLRGRAVRSVYETLSLRSLTKGRMPQELEDQERNNAHWLYQVHQRAIALHHSSFFIFPPGMTARVVLYNILHHWVTEMCILAIIIGYSIFTASWPRNTWPDLHKPQFMTFADVSYTAVYGIELLARLFALGGFMHPRAFFRSPWRCLDAVVFVLMVINCTELKTMWNFTAFMLIRVIKACVYLPVPIQIKLLSKTLLRSTYNVFQVSLILIYALFFFALMGLQLYSGTMHHRCVKKQTDEPTSLLCRPGAVNGSQSWGRACAEDHTCVENVFQNPHNNMHSFDSIGDALLSTFQIMTFQGWTVFLTEGYNTTSVLVIFYYLFTILLCSWFIPSLYLAVFIEKIEKTSRLFVLKQLQLFDSMLQEQRQRLNETIKLRDFVERDESGQLRCHPIERIRNALKGSADKQLSPSRTNINDGEMSNSTSTVKDLGSATARKRTRWTDEQRVQLHLSLTRQRNIAEQAERKRRVVIKSDKDNNRDIRDENNKASAPTGEQTTLVTGDFALGGRVGAVQHHPSTHTIGAAHGTDLPLAARLENEQEQLKFLKDYQTPADDEVEKGEANPADGSGGHSQPSTAPRGQSYEEASTVIHAIRESAGVIPNRNSVPPSSATFRVGSSVNCGGTGTNMASPTPTQPCSAANAAAHVPEVIIHDPEGGDFRYATTMSQRWSIVRNILHMFTEGYPRILTQYLWEHKQMQRRLGLMPLNYVNKYEDAMLRKLQQRRARFERQNAKKLREKQAGGDKELQDVGVRKASLNGIDGVGDLPPFRMARNIVENVPLTPFSLVMLFCVFANGIFNASRHYGQPESWDEGLFIVGVIFTSIFTLEIVVRITAMGPGPYFMDTNNILSCLVTVLGFFELGFARSNVVTVLNWVRFLRLFRVSTFTPMRRVARVLLLGVPNALYALFFFSVYMLMWILIGMSLFGGPNGIIDRTRDDYKTLGNFDTFADAAYAVSQAFSYTREEWLYASWDGVRSRGTHTTVYFVAVVSVAFILRYFFIAVFAWAWQCEEEEEEEFALHLQEGGGQYSAGPRLRWFDFTVWRSFKHIHGGFERRDVAPDEVFHLNEDMRRQLRIAEAKERFAREMLRHVDLMSEQRCPSSPGMSGVLGFGAHAMDGSTSPLPVPLPTTAPRYMNVGGQLQRQTNFQLVQEETQRMSMSAPITQFQAENAQLRFARRYSTVPASVYAPVMAGDGTEAPDGPPTRSTSSPSEAGLHGDDFSGGAQQQHQQQQQQQQHYHQLSLTVSSAGGQSDRNEGRGRRASVTGRFSVLGYERAGGKKDSGSRSVSGSVQHGEDEEPKEEDHNDADITGGSVVYEHALHRGPRLRYKHVMTDRYHRVFERCLDCNTHLQMPLRAPPNVQQRTAEELHAEHCHMAAVRSSRQLVLNAIMGYVRLQKELNQPPTREAVETVLGQAWSCGMLLFETIEYLSCADIEIREEKTWDRALESLQLQQWLISLHVGEEQVGRATLAYTLAHQEWEKRAVTRKTFKLSWHDRSLFVFPSNHPVRLTITNMLESWKFEVFMLCVIFASAITLCAHVPGKANDPAPGYVALRAFDAIFTVVFLVEMILKWISLGVVVPRPTAYFWRKWNLFEFAINIVSLIGLSDENSMLRCVKVLRCFRVFMPLRHCKFNCGLANLSTTIWECVPTVANIILLFVLNYSVWAIIAVRLFYGYTHTCTNETVVNGTLCEEGGGKWRPNQRNFDSLPESLLTLVEVSTGSKWLDIIYTGVEGGVHEQVPSPLYDLARGFFFFVYYYVSNFVFFSLFVASVVYSYLLAKNAAEGVLGITLEHQLWIRMQRMVLAITPKVRLVPRGDNVSRFLHGIIENPHFETFMASVLLANMLTMSLYYHEISKTSETLLNVAQYLWLLCFAAEVGVRVFTYGKRAFSRMHFCFDVFVLSLSVVQVLCNAAGSSFLGFNVNVLRMLRLGRLLRLVDLLPVRNHLRLLHKVLLMSGYPLMNVTLVLCLGVFVFSVIGLHLVGPVMPAVGNYVDNEFNNYHTFGNSLMMTLRLTTLENWGPMLRASMYQEENCTGSECGTPGWMPFFYISILVCLVLVVISLYIAVVVDHYVAAIRMNASVTRIQDLYRFRHLWSKADPNATLVLRAWHLPKLLESLRPPLGLSSRHNRAELMRLLREYEIPDHDGKVHYHEVLLPLARRVLAMAFSRDVMYRSVAFETLWRHSERSLQALPTVLRKHSHATAAEHFAASYLQAAYRRVKACRQVHQLRSELWHEGRTVCEELDLPYADYGFGAYALSGDDPMLMAAQRGYSIQSIEPREKQKGGADAEVGAHSPPWGIGRSASPTTTGSEADQNDGPPRAAHLPGVYQPATEDKEKRFGPDVPNAVRRHETRSEKLRRKEEERQQQQQLLPTPAEASATILPHLRSGSQRHGSNDYQPPLGTDPTTWLNTNKSRGAPSGTNIGGSASNPQFPGQVATVQDSPTDEE
ncbi:putative Ion transport protein Voltage dependent L type calcium channel IQ associated [Trypanosoma vivax]|nr:putative Ion transport protein Voltage dependent L type calcium channel IQ associated [Trypanosoma vivax]